MKLHTRWLLAAVFAAMATPALHAEPFTFQGVLDQSGAPVQGNTDLRFRLFNAAVGGSQLGATHDALGWPVADGLFTVDLDFPGVVFDGSPRWLEIEAGGEVLSPRLEILPAPLASSANALRGRTLSAAAPSAGQVLKWNGSQWAPAADDAGNYSAGTGLQLAAGQFALVPSYRLPQGCSNNQIPKWDGGAWTCQADAGTSYSAGTGLQLAAGQFAVVPSYRLPQGCSNNQIPKWNGSAWTCQADAGTTYSAGAGLTLAGTVFSASFAGSGSAATVARSDHHHHGASWIGAGAHGLTVESNDGFTALRGFNNNASGAAVGVEGGATDSTQGVGVLGVGAASGVEGRAHVGTAVGVVGVHNHAAGNGAGVRGTSASSSGTGILGQATASSGFTTGVRGESASGNGAGVEGASTGVSGGVGVRGIGNNGNGHGVMAMNLSGTGEAVALAAISPSSQAVVVKADAVHGSGSTIAVQASANGVAGTGVRASGFKAIEASSSHADGVAVLARNTAGSGTSLAMHVQGNGPNGDTLLVEALGMASSWALRARSSGLTGRAINATLTSGVATGSSIYGLINAPGGRAGEFVNQASGGEAARFQGDVNINGNLAKSGGSFRIDHPLDPENKYLYHSFVESPDMMNLYNGNVVTDRAGYATVELPEWFEALNGEFRYQLTVIGSFAQAIIAEEVSGNRFVIRSSEPGVKVSWQVTGVRQDPWARDHRIEVEVEKKADDKGRFLYPEGYGQPVTRRVNYSAEDMRPGGE